MNTRNTWVPALFAGAAALFCLGIPPAGAQDTATEAAEDLVEIQYPNIQIPIILNDYEQLTGKRIIRDVSVLGASMTIETSHKLTREEAARFIEKSLLLNGFALIPAGENTLKIIAPGKLPIQQGIDVYTEADKLPESEEVVTFLLPFDFLDTDEATKTLQGMFPSNAYGGFTSLPHVKLIAVTENTSVIRKILEVKEEIDKGTLKTDHQTITLERADATEVAEGLIEMLGLDSTAGPSSSGNRGPNALQAANQARNRENPQQDAAPGQAGIGERSQSVQPIIRALPRANRILIVALPDDMEYIVSLIEHFDAPVEKMKLVKHQLNYLSVAQFLPIVQDSLLRGLGSETAQQGAQISGGVTSPQGQAAGGFGSGTGAGGGFGTGSGIGSGSSSRGGIGGNSGGFGSGSGRGGAGSGIQQDIGPQSVVVDKTLLVADNVQNTLMVSGPSEDLGIIANLLEELDQKPRQIRLTAIIAQLTLGDDFEYGFDLLRTLETQGINGTKYNGAGVFKSRTGALNGILDINDLNTVDGFLPANQGLSLYGQINPYLNAYLHLLQDTNRFRVVSRPVVYTLNNRQASIFSGQRVAVPRSSQSVLDPSGGQVNNVVSSSIEFEEVILRIDVLPLINKEDNITLKISQLNDDIIGTNTIDGNEIPIIGTQSLDTTVIVPDGGTVLLGGLIADEEMKSRSGLPLFFNSPIFENVLGSKKRDRDRQELLIFIQPEIIDDDQEMAKADAKIDERTALSEDIEDFRPPAAKVRPVSMPSKEKGSKPGFFQRLLGIKGG